MPNCTDNKIFNENIFANLEHQSSIKFTLHTGQNVACSELDIDKGTTSVLIPIPIAVRIYIWTITGSSIFGITGNLLVLIVYLRSVKRITPFKFLVGHLAFCDCLFSFAQIFNVVASGWYTEKSHNWMLNLQFCKLTRSSDQLSSLVSVGTILAITIERFQGITHGIPSNARRNAWKKVLAVVSFIWIVSLISASPIYVSTELVNEKCQEEWNEILGEQWTKIYSIYMLLTFCLIPVVAMSSMNGMIIRKIKKPSRLNNICKDMLEDMATLRKRRDVRVIKVLLSVIVTFFICVLPIRVMFVAKSFFDLDGLASTDSLKIIYTGRLSYPFHVAINPIIYSIMDKAFRTELFRTLFCCEFKTTGKGTYNIISRNNNVLASFKPRIRELTNHLVASDLLEVPIDFKYPLLFPEIHQMTKEEEELFNRETYI